MPDSLRKESTREGDALNLSARWWCVKPRNGLPVWVDFDPHDKLEAAWEGAEVVGPFVHHKAGAVGRSDWSDRDAIQREIDNLGRPTVSGEHMAQRILDGLNDGGWRLVHDTQRGAEVPFEVERLEVELRTARDGEEAFRRGAERCLEALRVLADAAWHVPVKQHDRTDDEQARVERFTTATVKARELLRHYAALAQEAEHRA